MEKILRSSIFWAIFVLVTLVAFAFFTNLLRTFRSQTDLLIVAKNELTAKNFDGIINDSLNLPESLSFYERILSESRDIADEFRELSDFERQSGWEKKISLSRIDGSGIVRISVLDKDKKQSEIIGRQTALTLSGYLAKDYNIKTELDAKISNGPISYRVVSWGFISLLFISAFLGMIAGFIVSWLIFNFEKFNLNFSRPQMTLPVSLKEILKKKEKLVFWEGQPFEIEKMEISKSEEVRTQKKEEIKKEVKKEIFSQKAPISTPTFSPGRKAAAPENLPISGEEAEFLAKTSFEKIPAEPGDKIGETEKIIVGKDYSLSESLGEDSDTPQEAGVPLRGDSVQDKDVSEVKEETKKIIEREPTEEEVRERLLKLDKIENKNPSAEEAKKRLNDLLRGKI